MLGAEVEEGGEAVPWSPSRSERVSATLVGRVAEVERERSADEVAEMVNWKQRELELMRNAATAKERLLRELKAQVEAEHVAHEEQHAPAAKPAKRGQ